MENLKNKIWGNLAVAAIVLGLGIAATFGGESQASTDGAADTLSSAVAGATALAPAPTVCTGEHCLNKPEKPLDASGIRRPVQPTDRDTTTGVDSTPHTPTGDPAVSAIPVPKFSGLNIPWMVNKNGPVEVLDDTRVFGLLDLQGGVVNNEITLAGPPTLTVLIDPSTPAAGYIKRGSTENHVATFHLSAANGPIHITQIIVRDSDSTTTNWDLGSIKLYYETDLTAPIKTATYTSAGSGNYIATFSGLNLNIARGTSKKILVKANVSSSGTSTLGRKLKLGLNAAADITADAGQQIAGAFPALGNQFEIRDPQVIATIDPSTPSGGTVLRGTNDLVTTVIKLDAPYWPVDMSSIIIRRSLTTTARYENFTPIKLYIDGVHRNSIVTQSVLGGYQQATFSISGLRVEPGTTKIVTVKTNIPAASAQDLGKTLALGIPLGGITAVAPGGATTDPDPSGFPRPVYGSTFTIGAPGLTVELDTSTPALGNVLVNSTDNLTTVFKLTSTVTTTTITRLTLKHYLSATSADINQVKLYEDPNGAPLATTTLTPNGSWYQAVFNGLNITIDPGTPKLLYAKTDISAGATINKTFTWRINTATDIITSSQVFGTFPVEGSTFNISKAKLIVTLDPSTPATGNVASGTNDHLSTVFKLEASYGPVTVTGMTIKKDTLSTSATSADLGDISIFDGDTLLGSALFSDAIWGAQITGFNLTIDPSTPKTLRVTSDIKTDTAVLGHNFALGFMSSADISVGENQTAGLGAGGNQSLLYGSNFTITTPTVTAGELTQRAAANTDSDNDGDFDVMMSEENRSVFKFKLTANDGPATVTQLRLFEGQNASKPKAAIPTDIKKVKLFEEDGAAPLAETAIREPDDYVIFSGLNINLAANETKTLEVKVDIAPMSGSVSDPGPTFKFAFNPQIDISVAAGAAVNPRAAIEGDTFEIIPSPVVTVRKDNTSPLASDILPGTVNSTGAIFKLLADYSNTTVTGIKISRTTTGTAPTLTNIKLINGDAQIGSTVASLASSSATEIITFSGLSFPLATTGEKLLTVVADIPVATEDNQNFAFSIGAATDVSTDTLGTSVNAVPAFPVAGDIQTVKLPRLTVALTGSNPPNGNVLNGSQGNIVGEFNLTTTGSPITITGLTIHQMEGNANLADIESLELFHVANSTLLGTPNYQVIPVGSGSGIGARFTGLGLTIDPGTPAIFQIKAKIKPNALAGRTFRLGVLDASSVNASAATGNFNIEALSSFPVAANIYTVIAPDLRMASSSLSPETIPINSAATFSATFQNSGTAASPLATVTHRLCIDKSATAEPCDIPVTAATNSSTAVGAFQSINFSWTPGIADFGTHEYQICADHVEGDADGTIAESNNAGSGEANNCTAAGLTVNVVAADLQIAGANEPNLFKKLEVTTPVVPNEPATFTAYVKNNGLNPPQAGSIARLTINGITMPSDASTEFGGNFYTGAPSGQVYSAAKTWSWTPTTVGTYTAHFCADVGNSIEESDETNNCADLTVNVADIEPPTTPTLTATAASNIQIDLSWTASTDNVGVSGYSVEQCADAACATSAQLATPTATSYFHTGRTPGTTYWYRVRAVDAAGNWSAYSEIKSATTKAPNLIASLATLPALFTPGTPHQFTASISNNGTSAAGRTTAYRFCMDDENAGDCYTSAAKLISAGIIADLSPGGPSAPITSSGWNPTAGTHTIFVCADVGDLVDEIDDTSFGNCASRTFTVPVLTITKIDIPADEKPANFVNSQRSTILNFSLSADGSNITVNRMKMRLAGEPAATSLYTNFTLQRYSSIFWENIAAVPTATGGEIIFNGETAVSDSGQLEYRVQADITCAPSNIGVPVDVGAGFDEASDVESSTPPQINIVGTPVGQDTKTPTCNNPPTISIQDPAAGDIFSSETSTLTATVNDDHGVSAVTFKIDNAPIVLVTEFPDGRTYAANIDWSAYSNGLHAITVEALDIQGASSSSTINVLVDKIPPVTSVLFPDEGYTSNATGLTISASAGDTLSGIERVRYKIDGVMTDIDLIESPFPYNWNTTNGNHTIQAIAWDRAGNQTESAVTVNFTIDKTSPSITDISANFYENSNHDQPKWKVNWSSNEEDPGNVAIEYGTDSSLSTFTTIEGFINPPLPPDVTPPFGIDFYQNNELLFTPGVTNYYRIKMTDKVGNIGTSAIQSYFVNGMPDLMSEELTEIGTLEAGQAISLSAKISNIGNANAGNSKTRLYIALDNNSGGFSSYGIIEPEHPTENILSGGNLTETWPVLSFPAGTHKYKICADSNSDINEFNGTNNCTEKTFTIGKDITAPVVTNIYIDPPSITPTSAIINWVTNESANSAVGYGPTASYGSSSGPYDESPKVLNHSVNITGLTPGTLYHFKIRSDDEAGNIGYSTDQTFMTKNPDLIVSSIGWSPAIVENSYIQFSATVKNNGGAETVGSPVNLRFCINNASCATSTTGRIGVSDPSLLAADLPLGATKFAAAVNAPATWRAVTGNYILYACADTANNVPEANETNNCKTQSFTVRPDLMVESVSISPDPATRTAGDGTFYTFSGKVKNIGNAADTIWTKTQLKIDTNNNGTTDYASSTLSTSWDTGALAINGTETETWSLVWQAPSAAGATTHAFVICADQNPTTSLRLAESNEANNCTTQKFTVPGKLTAFRIENGEEGAARKVAVKTPSIFESFYSGGDFGKASIISLEAADFASPLASQIAKAADLITGTSVLGVTLYNPLTIFDDLAVKGGGTDSAEEGNFFGNGLIKTAGNIQTSGALEAQTLNAGDANHQIIGNLQINPDAAGVTIAGGDLEVTAGAVKADAIGKFSRVESAPVTIGGTSWATATPTACPAGDIIVGCSAQYTSALPATLGKTFQSVDGAGTCTAKATNTSTAPADNFQLKAITLCFSPDG